VVTPILIMTGSGPTSLNLEMADQQYLLSAALICSALLSLIQITRFKIWRTGNKDTIVFFCIIEI
jgi:NCS2 family nucleobase:cation symporter-2